MTATTVAKPEGSTDGEVLRLDQASKVYQQGPVEVVALAPADLAIRAGEFVGGDGAIRIG